MSIAAQKLDVTAVIRDMDDQFVRNATAGQVDALVDGFYAPDAQVFPPGQSVVTGHASIRELWQGVISAGMTGLTLETRHIEASGDMAYGSGRYTMTMVPAGQPPVTTVGKYVVVYRRQQNGAWRAVADIFNSD